MICTFQVLHHVTLTKWPSNGGVFDVKRELLQSQIIIATLFQRLDWNFIEYVPLHGRVLMSFCVISQSATISACWKKYSNFRWVAKRRKNSWRIWTNVKIETPAILKLCTYFREPGTNISLSFQFNIRARFYVSCFIQIRWGDRRKS